MNYNLIFNSTGLMLDIVGAILLFKFGLPENINKNGHIYLALEQENKNEKIKAKKYDYYSKIALVFIILGFIFQFISNFF